MHNATRYISLFFSLILLCNIIFFSVFGADFTPDTNDMLHEDFEDELIGNIPVENWYTFNVQGKITDYVAHQGTQSVLLGNFTDPNDPYSSFYFDGNNDTDNLVCDVWIYKNQTTEVNDYDFLMKNSTFENAWRVRLDVETGKIQYESLTGYWTTGDAYQNNTWLNLVVRMNFTTHKWNFAVHDDNGMYITSVKNLDMINNVDNIIDFLTFNCVETYLDDLRFYIGHPPVVQPTAFITNNTADVDPDNVILSIDTSDLNFDHENDTFDTVNFWVYNAFMGVGIPSWTNVGHIPWGTNTNSTLSVNASANYTFWNNDQYLWYVTVTDRMNNGGEYPEENNEGIHAHTAGEGWHYGWNFTTEDNAVPSITSNVCGTTFTSDEWRNNHTMCLDVNDPEGDTIDLELMIYCEEKSEMIRWVRLYDICNETICIDMQPYVFWDNMDYQVLIWAYESSKDPTMPSYIMWCNFTIGTYANDDHYIGFSNLYPMHHEEHAYHLIGNKLSYEACGSNTDGDHIHYFAVRRDLATNQSMVISYSHLDDMVYWNNYGILLGNTTWQKFYHASFPFSMRYTYSVYLGVSQSRHPVADTEISSLYDKCVSPLEFSLVKESGSYWRIVEETLADTVSQEPYYGIRYTFHTFPDDEDPWSATSDTHDVDWGDDTIPNKFKKAEDETGIAFLSFIAGLLIIGMFAIMPLIANYKVLRPNHKKNIPLPIHLGFTLLGVALAFEMGFFPLWIVAFVFAILLLIIVYSVFSWVKSRHQTGMTNGGANV